MSKLIVLSLIALVSCVTLAYATMYSTYMVPGGVYNGGTGFNSIGNGGIMQFFFAMIFLMFMMEILRGFGSGGSNKKGY